MDIEVLQRAYEREKERRKKAEVLLEERSRELYLRCEELDKSHSQLEQINVDLAKQKEELVTLINAYASVTDDLQLAAKLQADLLPDPLIGTRATASGYFQPAKYVAGDAYDYYKLTENIFAFYIFDVEGHGTASAMTSFAIHSQLNPKYDGICSRTLKKYEDHSKVVCETVKQLNSGFFDARSTTKYFTMIYGLIELNTGVTTWCQAGHPPLILSTNTKVSEIGDGGFPVGMLEDPQYSATSITMNPGDRIAVYSDGIVECFSSDEEPFGAERLVDLIGQSQPESQQQCTDRVKDCLLEWNGSAEFADDVTLMLVDYHGVP